MMTKIIVVSGPTGVGKTDFSLAIASKFEGEIINADASQFKKGLSVGTAKITASEMKGINHHLIDIIDANDDFSISDYQKLARLKVEEIVKRNHLPIVVGGSGLYIDALINDYKLDAIKSNHQEIEATYQNYTNFELYDLLKSLDENLANLTHPNNRTRVLRYIERAKCGSSIEDNKSKPLYDTFYIFLTRSRDSLYERINTRVLKMLENGWIDEVKNLKKQGIDLKSIKEIGYKEIDDYLEGKINYDEMVSIISQNTRHYAKRQITWFKNKTNHIDFDLDKQSENEIFEKISLFLEGEKDEK